MKYLIFLPLLLLGCSDWPTKDNHEEAPIEIKINIDNQNILDEAPDNDTMDVDVDSDANSDSDSSSDSSSDSDSSSESSIDNSTSKWFYPVIM
jgi:hypothetical protein